MFVERRRLIFIFGGFFFISLEAELIGFGWWQTQRAPHLSTVYKTLKVLSGHGVHGRHARSHNRAPSWVGGGVYLVQQHNNAERTNAEERRV